MSAAPFKESYMPLKYLTQSSRNEDISSHKPSVSAAQFQQLLRRCSLGERRPTDDLPRLKAMLDNSDLVVSAWDGNTLVGIARSVTDFHYCCYLSDLAVDERYQRQGVGKTLIEQTEQALAAGCKLILIAAPTANDYYAPLGFEANRRCWVKAC